MRLDRALLDRFAQIGATGATDPIRYYRHPIVGGLFRARIDRGLALLGERRFERALEIGYAAGAVLGALRPAVRELHGLDLDADPAAVAPRLEAMGLGAPPRLALARGDARALPYQAGAFDLVVSFSVFEHIAEVARALAEVARVLAPGGLFLLGMPTVRPFMSAGFRAIGFRGIDEHHVTTPEAARAAFAPSGLHERRVAGLDAPLPRPLGVRVYHHFLLEKRA